MVSVVERMLNARPTRAVGRVLQIGADFSVLLLAFYVAYLLRF